MPALVRLHDSANDFKKFYTLFHIKMPFTWDRFKQTALIWWVCFDDGYGLAMNFKRMKVSTKCPQLRSFLAFFWFIDSIFIRTHRTLFEKHKVAQKMIQMCRKTETLPFKIWCACELSLSSIFASAEIIAVDVLNAFKILRVRNRSYD